jgi:hypothetical protein
MIDAPGNGRATQRSGCKDDGASPVTRVCKSFSLQRLRSMFHTSMARARQEAQPTRAAADSPDLRRSTDRERGNSGEMADTVSDTLSRWGMGDWPSRHSTGSFLKETSDSVRAPARGRVRVGLAGGSKPYFPLQ